MKNKLFLNSNDVERITGVSLRSSRKILEWVRNEKNLGKMQAVSIYDFCACFNLPLDVVFCHINSKEFNLLPIDEVSIRERQKQKDNPDLKVSKYLHSKDFDLFTTKERSQKVDTDDTNDDGFSESSKTG